MQTSSLVYIHVDESSVNRPVSTKAKVASFVNRESRLCWLLHENGSPLLRRSHQPPQVVVSSPMEPRIVGWSRGSSVGVEDRRLESGIVGWSRGSSAGVEERRLTLAGHTGAFIFVARRSTARSLLPVPTDTPQVSDSFRERRRRRPQRSALSWQHLLQFNKSHFKVVYGTRFITKSAKRKVSGSRLSLLHFIVVRAVEGYVI